MNEYEDISPAERLNRICDILIRGIYLHAEEEGWTTPLSSDISAYSSQKPSKKLQQFDLKKFSVEVKHIHHQKLYTLRDAAKILKISKRTLQRWAKDGKIRSVKNENGYLHLPQEEMNYLITCNL